jgi:hypothetical protein
MHKLLVDTHRDSFVNILRARTYYIEKAMKYHKTTKRLSVLPTLVIIFSYVILFLTYVSGFFFTSDSAFLILMNQINEFATNNIEIISGVLTLLIYFVIGFLNRELYRNKEISCMLREVYDNRLFNITGNPIAYDYSNVEEHIKMYEKAPADYNKWKYEYWYDEVFCDDLESNIISMQMDNVIYTYRAFELYKKEYEKQLIKIIILTVALIAVSWYLIGFTMGLFMLFALFDIISSKYEEVKVAEDMVQRNRQLKYYVEEELVHSENRHDIILFIENTIIENRKNGLFLPKKVRRLFIDYYDELDKIKTTLLENHKIDFPESAEELEILSLDEQKTYPMTAVHAHLKRMLFDVADQMEKEKIPYSLDGGTLLGAAQREKFLFWDDNVNLMIGSESTDKLQKIIKEKLAHKYKVILPGMLPGYPMHSHMQIREQGHLSRIDEKYLEGKYEGLFINVRVSDICTSKNTTKRLIFEGRSCRVVDNYQELLRKQFGDRWTESIFHTRKELQDAYGSNWYSKTIKFHCSSYKHLRHIDLFDVENAAI